MLIYAFDLTPIMAATTTSRRPSDAEWLTHLPRICELYYGQRYTLEDTQRTLQHETGFTATLRMYKDRIRNMAVHPKKICMQKYQAMSVVADDHQRRGISVYFVGPSGFQLFRRTPAQITKQLRRPHCLQPITLDEAHHVLRQSSIQAVVEHTVPTTHQVNSGAHYAVRPHAVPSHPSTVQNNGYWQPSVTVSDPGDHLEFDRRPVDQSRTVSLPSIYSSDTEGPNKLASLAGHGFGGVNTSELPIERSGDKLSLAGLKLLPERLLKSNNPKGEQEANDSYDFIAELDAISLDSGSSTPLTPFDPTERLSKVVLPPPSASHRLRIATECAAPFFLACFPKPATEALGFSKAVAMQKFRYILSTTPENHYLLPLLNWMSTILASNDKWKELTEFVGDCCDVLHDCPDSGFPLSTPYRYLLAFCNDDQHAMDSYGSQFAAGTERLTQLYGSSHPNVLVNEYYRAWHALSRPNGWNVARPILERCYSEAEKTMGSNNLMTINCLTILGRCFTENGLNDRARSIYQDIVDNRLDPTTIARPLQTYRLMILQRLAMEEEHVPTLLHQAETHHREVCNGRLQYLTASNPETRGAVNSLATFLRKHGRSGEAMSIERHYDECYTAECNNTIPDHDQPHDEQQRQQKQNQVQIDKTINANRSKTAMAISRLTSDQKDHTYQTPIAILGPCRL